MKYVLAGALIFAAALISLGASGGKPVRPKAGDPQEEIFRLKSASERDAIKILNAITEDRDRFQKMIMAQLDSTSDKDRKIYLVYLLGLYRTEAAVNNLAKIIDLEAKFRLNDAEGLWDQYPAVEALAKIGRRAIPAMLANIENAASEKVHQLSVKVIRSIEGEKIAKIILEDAVSKQTDPKKKKNLAKAMQLKN